MDKVVERDGAAAFKAGKTLSHNPYFDIDTVLYHHWMLGFEEEKKRHLANQDKGE